LGNAFGADGATYTSGTATGSRFDILNYPGTDTRIAGQKYSVLIASTTDIFVRATSSADYQKGLTGSDTFDGTLHIEGFESKR